MKPESDLTDRVEWIDPALGEANPSSDPSSLHVSTANGSRCFLRKDRWQWLALVAVWCWCVLGWERASGFSSPAPVPDSTGAVGHEHTCASCHAPENSTPETTALFSFSGGELYSPGQTYTIQVAIPAQAGRLAGFEMVARDADKNSTTVGTAGEWVFGDDANVKLLGTVPDLQVGHAPAKPATSNSVTYTVKWKAPAVLTGDVIFYAVAVSAMGPTGGQSIQRDDRFFTKVFTIKESAPPSQTRVVSTKADSGAGSLRQAVADAAANDTIVFAAALDGDTITLAGSQILINKSLTIDASALGHGVTMSGDNRSRVFSVEPGATVTLDKITVTKGSSGASGGGIFNNGALTVKNARITGNSSSGSGGGIHNDTLGSLIISKTTIDGNSCGNSGGGISNVSASLEMVDSTVSGNDSLSGGGISIVDESEVDIQKCTVSGNASEETGGGLYTNESVVTLTEVFVAGNVTGQFGGGIYNSESYLEISRSAFAGNSSNERGGGLYHNTSLEDAITLLFNCTFANNSAAVAGGAIRNLEGPVILDHCTISRNSAPEGGGVASYGDALTLTEVFATIIAANSSGDVDLSPVESANSFSSLGFSLIGKGSAVGEFVQEGDSTGITSPLLGPLYNNGGYTPTMLPLPGSPAINAGNAASVDQRGVVRPVGIESDIGAVEAERISFDLEWSGASLGNSATATARITIDPDQLMNPGNTEFDTLIDFSIRVSGASLGNGLFDRTDFDRVFLSMGSQALDVSGELLNQPTGNSPWGTSMPGGSGGDFNMFRSSLKPEAPSGTWYFELTTAGGERMLLTSFRPASGSAPAGSIVHPPGLATAFASRATLATFAGQSVPAPVGVTSNGGTTVWQWTPPVDGWFDVNTFGSSFDTRLTVYEGTTANGLVFLAENDDAYPGEFSGDHPEPDRSAVVIPLSAGKPYQFVVGKGPKGGAGGSLQWRISLVNEPLPPAVEIRTHFPFDFEPSEYAGGTALVDTIVPVGEFGAEEPYVHVLDTRVGVWDTGGGGEVKVSPIYGGGSILRGRDAKILSSLQRRSGPIGGGFTSPTSKDPGPFVTVASARYPHRFGGGQKSITVDLKAEGGQGYGLTHMPKEHLTSATDIAAIGPNQGGLQVKFEFIGAKPASKGHGYILKNSAGTTLQNLDGDTAETRVITGLSVGSYSIQFKPVEGYRIVVVRDGVGEEDRSRPNINIFLPNVIEDGQMLVDGERTLSFFFPNSAEGKHFTASTLRPPVLPLFVDVRRCNVREGMVTTVTVQYIQLGTGTEVVGYFNVPDRNKVLDDDDVTGSVSNPLVESPLLRVPAAGETKVLVMFPDEEAGIGRVVKWKKQSNWIQWRNFVALGRSFPKKNPSDPQSPSLCFDCHTRNAADLPNTIDPVDGLVKSGGGEPRVPWFKPTGGPRFIGNSDNIVARLVPLDAQPYTLAVLNRPFDENLNFRMPVDIDPNGPGQPARYARVDYANQSWYIQQAAGAGYVPKVTISGPDLVNLDPGTGQLTVKFSNASGFWSAEARDSPWIRIIGSPFGSGAGMFSLTLRLDPNPGARPRFGTVQIGDVFINFVQPIEPVKVLSIDPLVGPPGFRFNFNTVNGLTYKLEYSESLAPGGWETIRSITRGRETSPVSWENFFPTGKARGFYRISYDAAPLPSP
jgi:hypothetical protein